MREIKLLILVPRPLFSHTRASGFKRREKKSDSCFFQFSTYCDPFRNARLTQKLNFLIGQQWFLTFLKYSAYCYLCKCTGYCDMCRISEVIQKRCFSVGQRKDLKFLQYSSCCDPCSLRVGCLRDSCVVDLNAEDACIPTNMLDLLRCGAIGNVRS